MPYAVESIPDENLGQGEEQIVQQGQNGRKRVKLNIVSVDGQVADKETISTELISEMQPMVRKVGTKATVEINTGSISHYQKSHRHGSDGLFAYRWRRIGDYPHGNPCPLWRRRCRPQRHTP